MTGYLKIWGLTALVICSVVMTGCSNEQRIADGKPLRSRDPNNILKRYDKGALKWDWIGFKVDAEIKVEGKEDSFTMNVRMARDSAIWISLSPALGVELARVLLLPDSVRVISKVPSNKFVFEANYTELEKSLGIPFDFYTFQDLFSGKPLGMKPQEDKFISQVDGFNYILIEKFPRRVKKLLGGTDEREIALNPEGSIGVIIGDRRANRMMSRTDEDDLVIRRYWFDGVTFMPVIDMFNDLSSGLSLKIKRSGDEGHRQGLLPTKTRIIARGNDVDLDCTLKIRRSRINREYELPFDPPENYERRKSL
ncbi:MAG: hypothetical protein CL831_01310 [Crocinitomicaceae bacterium]|nr:hypothetical protein [Crocinitomicaceae bacterium]